jgi:hypothetical protein
VYLDAALVRDLTTKGPSGTAVALLRLRYRTGDEVRYKQRPQHRHAQARLVPNRGGDVISLVLAILKKWLTQLESLRCLEGEYITLSACDGLGN